jgi:energy-coupling factor transporter transmembrane protein EcfT
MNTPNWALWLALSMAYCSATYHPLYQLLLGCAILIAAWANGQSVKSYVKAGLLVSAVPLFVNLFLVHSGKTVLYTVPYSLRAFGLRVPTLFFAGPVTFESALMGAVMAVFITNMLGAFRLFSAAAAPEEILRLVPQAFPSAGLAASVSLRFMPTLARDWQAVREAQASRGVRMDCGPAAARARNQAGILAPAAVTSLERGFNLAESMAARGYSGKRTQYRRPDWGSRERAFQAVLLAALAATALAKLSGALEYWPYDSSPPSPASALAALPILALLIPALWRHESVGTA